MASGAARAPLAVTTYLQSRQVSEQLAVEGLLHEEPAGHGLELAHDGFHGGVLLRKEGGGAMRVSGRVGGSRGG